MSTESGIPDYRSAGVGLYARSNHKPVQHQEFMKSKLARQRYWARNFTAWKTFSSFKPNQSHLILAEWEKQGKISTLVTQNIDRLHKKAGTKSLVELHGTAYTVRCTNTECNFRTDRHKFQETLLQLNPNLLVSVDDIRPDGDVNLPQVLA